MNENHTDNVSENEVKSPEKENLENASPENEKAVNEDSAKLDEEMAGLETEDSNAADAVQLEREKYIRLYSEFENFRRRTAKERLDLIQNSSKEIIELAPRWVVRVVCPL
jgi:molecular chaperone GrpE